MGKFKKPDSDPFLDNEIARSIEELNGCVAEALEEVVGRHYNLVTFSAAADAMEGYLRICRMANNIGCSVLLSIDPDKYEPEYYPTDGFSRWAKENLEGSA